MAKYGDMTFQRTEDLINKMGGLEAVARFLSGELILVERTKQVSPSDGLANGGVTYASGLDTAAFLEDWTKFYQDVFGLTADLSQVPLPPYRPGFHWGVAVLQGLTKQQAFNKGRELFFSWKYTDQDLDETVPQDKDERTAANGSYVVWCRPRVEPDEEHKNKSANDIKAQGIKSMTLLERLLLGLWFFWKTKRHLDVKNITLCAGSRDSGGSVSSMYLDRGGYVRVDWGSPGDASSDLRVREVVSL